MVLHCFVNPDLLHGFLQYLVLVHMLVVYLGVLPLTKELCLLLKIVAVVHAGVVGCIYTSLVVFKLVVYNVFLSIFNVLSSVEEWTLPHLLIKAFVKACNGCKLLTLLVSLLQHQLVVILI